MKVGDAGPELLGVRDPDAGAPYVPRPVDDALEDACGQDRPLVVVTGERLAGTSRAVHRALRRMLGDRLLLPVADPHGADLAAVLRTARAVAARSGPVVVVADDAPPSLLDQLTAEVHAALTPAVRLVLTTRRTFLDAHLAPAIRARLADALVVVPGDPPIGETVRPVARAHAVLDPVGWSSRAPLALLRAAVDHDRLGVPLPLTPALLVELAPPYLAALGTPAPSPAELRGVVRQLLRADHGGVRLLHALPGGRTLAADRLFSHLADRDTAGWAVPEDLARELWHRLAPDDRARLARVALARGDDQVALWLATGVPPDDLEPEALYRLGVVLAARSAAHTPDPGRWDGGALRWLTAALDRADPDLVARTHRAILEIEARRDQARRDQARPDGEDDLAIPQARRPADAAPAPESPAAAPAPEPDPDPAPPSSRRLIYLRPRETSRS
ncbi:hypothetical protein [Actinomycetospora straminea]|uniref:Uncharacterized protein n=1 Tax=Actinomycetospora straminea TaxID=663607 RepID=A0ABP9DZC3_9PSEU|nr:hypothetical protein [Actinomycetospora straminea]